MSYTWSSSYLVNPTLSAGVQPLFERAAPRGNLDASFNYRWNDQITLTLNATNLNNGLNKLYDGNAPLGQALYNVTYARYDTTYSIGIRYRM